MAKAGLRQSAVRLRIGGRSYNEIARELGVSKSTLSLWLSRVVLSEAARKRLESRGRKSAIQALIRRNKQQTIDAIERAREIRKRASSEIFQLSSREILLLGVALYWAEGYKKGIIRNGRERTSHIVSLTNSDPKLVRFFVKFLRENCLVPHERIRIWLRFFKHQNERHLKRFWSSTLSIPTANFGKSLLTVSAASKGRRPYNQLPYGVVQVSVNDTKLYHRIMGYIEGVKNLA